MKKIILTLLLITLAGILAFNKYSSYQYEARIIKNREIFLQRIQENPKIAVHRVNSLRKLSIVEESGISKYEMDLIWNSELKLFQVCHDKPNCTNLALVNMLEKSQFADFIWLDIKNLNPTNVKEAMEHLLAIEEAFSLRSRILVETTSLTKDVFEAIHSTGFSTSYYLPTGKILNGVDKVYEQELFEFLKTAKFKNISFDCRLYNFVSSFVKKYSLVSLKYYTWDLSERVHGFVEKNRETNDCANNKNTRIILLPL